MADTSSEKAWRETVYRGSGVPQLTVRAVLTGAAIGILTGVSNLYVGLKVGWSVGVVLTASIVGWAVWRAAARWNLLKSKPTVLEANAMASTASAAGYSTGTTLAAALSAYLIVAGHHLALWQLTAWVLAISLLGLFVAIPLKRALINVEQLPFPTGAAAAQTLRTLYERDDAGATQARALLWALGVGVALKWCTGAMPILAEHSAVPTWMTLPERLPTEAIASMLPTLGTAAAYTWTLEVSALLPAAGVLVGMRVATSMLVGAVVCYGVVAPRLVAAEVITGPSYRAIVDWSVWPGTTLMIVGGLVSLAFRWRSVANAFADLTAMTRGTDRGDTLAGIEPPRSWFFAGAGAAGLACVILQRVVFDIPIAVGVAAVVLAVALAVVAARVTGETDITPMGPLGKVAQLGFGPVVSGAAPNLMVASVTAGAAASSADLLTDLKSGHLLGANPRQQFLAQLVGVVVGAVCIVPVFRYVLVPNVEVLGTEQWPATAAKMWAAVANAMSAGLESLPSSAVQAAAVAGVLAIALATLEQLRPAWRRVLPSATGLGIAFVLPASSALAFFIGAAAAALLGRRYPARAKLLLVPIAAGLIAGESLTGTATALFAGLGT